MTLADLLKLSRLHTRDLDSALFENSTCTIYINEGIDRLRQWKPLRGMTYLKFSNDEPIILPSEYHYLLSLWCSSRCFDYDERFYEATEKRDEFENAFAQFRADVECGTITLVDGDGNPIDLSTDGDCIIDHVKDVYFKNYERDEDVIEVL